jgi:hypothetical protein
MKPMKIPFTLNLLIFLLLSGCTDFQRETETTKKFLINQSNEHITIGNIQFGEVAKYYDMNNSYIGFQIESTYTLKRDNGNTTQTRLFEFDENDELTRISEDLGDNVKIDVTEKWFEDLKE